MVPGRLIALLSGMLFGAGLALSGMVDPVRVRAFLDILGHWDPTLGFVMGGAMLPMALAWRIRKTMARPVAEAGFHLPDTKTIDWRLMAGAMLFGIGWGIAGLCPGPALADLALVPGKAAIFVAAMLVGMGLFRLIPAKTVVR